MSRKRIIYTHLFIWLFAIFANLPGLITGHKMDHLQIVSSTIAFLYLMVVFYLFYSLIAPIFLNKKNITGFFIVSFFAVLIMPFFGYTLLFFSRALFEGTFHHFYKGYSLRMHMSGYFPVLTAATFGSFFRVIVTWLTTVNQKTELDKQTLRMELDLLKSKLNPHFLFNTLNNIDYLINTNQAEASAALIRLSQMMRYLTYETAPDTIILEREVEYINNYVELFRIRLKKPDAINFEVTGDLNIMIAPALFVPLIENAFKYASYNNHDRSVDITLLSENKIITFTICNSYDKNSEKAMTPHSGYGIINLKKRLELSYSGRYQFTIDDHDNYYCVNLIINTHAD